ncbi:unnamed protein product [Rhizophagus irregularis]|uniref:Uncharacterized protein n=1 Tax=Rhizophagus irregularis TaxID=588596 RepID=A0A915ZPJ9_9GLOM|nr:unnamed protein product [Rhizophagus irregularis]
MRKRTLFNILVRARQLQSFDLQSLKFSRLLTMNGYHIGSNWTQQNETWAHVNYSAVITQNFVINNN